MITYDKRPLWRRPGVWVAALGVCGAAAAWWWSARAVDGHVGAPGPSARSPLADAPQTLSPAVPNPPPVGADGRPADFNAAEWSALKDAMAESANPQAELQRVVAYLRFQRGFEQWQAMQDQPDVAARQRLGRGLVAQLPDRVQQGEVTLGEAMMLGTAIWADLEDGEAPRKAQLDALKARLEAAVPVPDAEQQAREAALLAEYKRREAAIVADWQARPAAERSQARLEEALEGARRAVYGGRDR